MKRKIFLSVVVLSFTLLLIYFFQTSLYRFRSAGTLNKEAEIKLFETAANALQSSDVPVGAVIIYDNAVLASGFNTVYRDSSAGAHAEINAISNAIRGIGFKAFSKLDRDKLILVTTFEPCAMCRGAIIEYNIRHVVFMKDKGIFHWLKEDMKQLRYEWNKRQAEGAEKQDSLFRLHPEFIDRN
jgi:tRNA(Arg) A34 adenosine deaminase TadA